MTQKDQVKTLPRREEQKPEYTWDLTPLYQDDAAWEKDFAQAGPLLAQAAQYEGSLGQGWENLLSCLEWQEQTNRLLEKLSLYAFLRRDEDTANSHYQAIYQRVEMLLVDASSKMAFFAPELLALPEEITDSYLNQPELALYRVMLMDILRERPHLLSPEQERLLAGAGEMAGAFDNIYTMLTEADLRFPTVEMEDGQQEQLSLGNYSRMLRSRSRRVREQAYAGMMGAFAAHGNTIAATYSASAKKDNFYALARRYPSALAASLFGDDVPEQVYRELIQATRKHIPSLTRYLQRRRELLQVEKLHMYDMYVPLFPELPLNFQWEQAQELVLEALAPLGEKYQQDLAQGLAERWVDVYENQGKGSGAYSASCYDSLPYILMNFQEDLVSVFTLAHEAGHSLHSLYSQRNQPYVYGDYSIFVAEVASTVNEHLLMKHLLNQARDTQEKAYLVNHFIDEFRGTLFQQVLFSEFELKAHEMAAKGEPLTPESLCGIYGGLLRDYFGGAVELTPVDSWGWARIPHFYRAYYVYKYATGFSAATALAEGLTLEDKEQAQANQQRYIRFLSSGSSAHPLELLTAAGVDLRQPEPVERALCRFDELVEQL